MAPRAALTLAWASSRAATSLAVAAAAWMLSGLTPSPLLNSLLPVATTLPLLLPLPFSPRLGAAVQWVAALLLLAIAARLLPLPVAATLAAILLLAAGVQLADLPLQRLLTSEAGVPMATLRSGAEAGRLAGNLLAGVLFPIGKALLQFSQVLVLLLPLTALVAWLQPGPASPAAVGGCEPSPQGTPPSPWLKAPLLQGAVFGALFGLIPLWVRQEGAGNCFDYAMVLTAYGLGRAAAEALQGRWCLPLGPSYLVQASALAGTQLLPGWGAVLLFLPLGLVAAGSDQRVMARLAPADDPTLQVQRFGRSACLGALVGGLTMGLVGQLLGLTVVLPLQLLVFGVAALLMPRLAAA